VQLEWMSQLPAVQLHGGWRKAWNQPQGMCIFMYRMCVHFKKCVPYVYDSTVFTLIVLQIRQEKQMNYCLSRRHHQKHLINQNHQVSKVIKFIFASMSLVIKINCIHKLGIIKNYNFIYNSNCYYFNYQSIKNNSLSC